MEQQIKFRGKRLDNGEWVYAESCIDNNYKLYWHE